MKRALNVSRVLIFLGVFAIALAANAAAVDYFITAINADGMVSVREAAGQTLHFRVPDAKAFGMLKVGQQLLIDTATGQASMQDFHFIILQDKSSPRLMTAAAVPEALTPRQVMINGKLLSTSAKLLNGKLFVPLEDFSSALGGGVTLDSSLKLEFPRLMSVGGAQAEYLKIESAHKVESAQNGAPAALKIDSAQKIAPTEAQLKMNPAGYKEQGQLKMGEGSVRGLKFLSMNRGGMISSQLQMVNGQVYVPLGDILVALGQDPSKMNTNAMSLNFTVPAVQGTMLGVSH